MQAGIDCRRQPIERSSDYGVCALLGGQGAPCTRSRPCPRERVLGDLDAEIDGDAGAVVGLWVDTLVANERMGIGPAVLDSATAGLTASERGEVVWRLAWLEKWARQQHEEQRGSDA